MKLYTGLHPVSAIWATQLLFECIYEYDPRNKRIMLTSLVFFTKKRIYTSYL